MLMSRRVRLALIAASLSFAAACATNNPRAVVDAGLFDSSIDDASGADTGNPVDASVDGPLPRPTAIDLLFMIDNSGSMAQEQATLAEQIPNLVRALATGDRDLDGTPDFVAADGLHVGVVTSDLGVLGNVGIPTCDTEYGNDGMLSTSGNTSMDGCMAMYDRFTTFVPGEHPGDLAAASLAAGTDVACVAAAGTSGCGVEQQLEAVLKALTPSTDTSTVFYGNTYGRADGTNAGFLRPDALLAVVLLTDEDDCSVDPANAEIFNQASSEYTGDLNLRCFNYPGAAFPISRYVDGLRALKPGRPDLVVLSAIIGVPTDFTGSDFAALLARPEMQEQIRTDGPMAGHQIRPVCTAPEGRGEAFPARRIVQAAAGFGPYASVHSICDTDYSAALDKIVDAVIGATP